MKISLSRWIGAEGAAFERVGLAFQVYGYQPPTPEIEEGTGAYVSNIIEQYASELSILETLAIINYGITHSREHLQQEIAEPVLMAYTLQELAWNYRTQ